MTPKLISPHGSVVVARRFAMFSAAGLNVDGLTRLLTNGARSVTWRPPLQAGDAKSVKSPASIAAVGTNWMFSTGR